MFQYLNNAQDQHAHARGRFFKSCRKFDLPGTTVAIQRRSIANGSGGHGDLDVDASVATGISVSMTKTLSY